MSFLCIPVLQFRVANTWGVVQLNLEVHLNLEKHSAKELKKVQDLVKGLNDQFNSSNNEKAEVKRL